MVERRTEKSKEYELADGRRRLICSIAPIHKPNGGGELEEIDTDWVARAGAFGVKFAGLYTAQTLPGKIGVRVQNPDGGDAVQELVEVGTGITIFNVSPEISENTILWRDVVPGLDIWLRSDINAVEFFKRIKTVAAPDRFVWRRTETNTTQLEFGLHAFAQENAGQPNKDRREVEMTRTRAAAGGRDFLVEETLTGRSRARDGTATIGPWERVPLRYPVVVDDDVTVTLIESEDDGEENTYPNPDTWTWDITGSGADGITCGNFDNHNGAWRFQIPTIAENDTIGTPTYLRVGVRFRSGAFVGRLIGNDVDNVGQLSTTIRPNGAGWTNTSNYYDWTAPANNDSNIPSSGTGLADIIDEIINGTPARWSPNDFLALAINHTSQGSPRVEIRDLGQSTSYYSENHPQLYITYTPGVSRTPAEELVPVSQPVTLPPEVVAF